MSKQSVPLRVVAPSPQDAHPGAEPADRYQTLWASFERYARVTGLQPQTVAVYADAVRGLRRYLVERGLPTDPEQITRQHIEGYLGELRTGSAGRRALKPSTILVRHTSLGRWFRWMVEEEEIERSPLERLKMRRVEWTPAPALSEEQLAALFAATEGRGFEERRDRALFRLLLDSGLRRKEAADIAVEDVALGRQVAHVLAKGGRVELAKYGDKTALDLDRYLRVRAQHPLAHMTVERPSNHPLASLTVGSQGGRVHPLWLHARGAVSGDALHDIVKRRARQAGLDERTIHPHLFRHTFAHMLKAAGASDEVTMDLGRWRDPAMMRRYARAQAVERAHAAHKALSPGDRV